MRGTGENKGGGVEDDVVRDADVVRVRDKASIRAVVFQGRTKVETHSAEVITSFMSGIVCDNEGATGSNGMR